MPIKNNLKRQTRLGYGNGDFMNMDMEGTDTIYTLYPGNDPSDLFYRKSATPEGITYFRNYDQILKEEVPKNVLKRFESFRLQEFPEVIKREKQISGNYNGLLSGIVDAGKKVIKYFTE